MEYDHLLIPGVTHRQPAENILEDVKKQAKEWHDKELPLRLKVGVDGGEALKRLDEETENWIKLEFQRRMNWNYEEESIEALK